MYILLNFSDADFYIDQYYGGTLITSKQFPELLDKLNWHSRNRGGYQYVNSQVPDSATIESAAHFSMITENGPVNEHIIRNVLYSLVGLPTISTYHNSKIRELWYNNGGASNPKLSFIEDVVKTAKVQYTNPMIPINTYEDYFKCRSVKIKKENRETYWNNLLKDHLVFKEAYDKLGFGEETLHKKWLLNEGVKLTCAKGFLNPNIRFVKKEKDWSYKTITRKDGKIIYKGCGFAAVYSGIIEIYVEDNNTQFIERLMKNKMWCKILDGGIVKVDKNFKNFSQLSPINGQIFQVK